MTKGLLLIALGFWVAATVGMTVRELRRRREGRNLKSELQRWEDEGGNVPEVPTVRPRRPAGN